MTDAADVDVPEDVPDGDPWWCWECQGLGGWEEDGDLVDWGDPVDVDCPCCGGNGEHYGDAPPACVPQAKANTP